MSNRIEGNCLCGAVRITLRDPAGWIGVCHCRMCQRWAGSLWAGFPAQEDTVSVEGPVRRYDSSPMTERAFCETCGSHLWTRDHADDAPYDLMPGLFDAALEWPLKSEIYADEAMKALPLEGGHRRISGADYRLKNPQVREIAGGRNG